MDILLGIFALSCSVVCAWMAISCIPSMSFYRQDRTLFVVFLINAALGVLGAYLFFKESGLI